jgi:hypothetical protein
METIDIETPAELLTISFDLATQDVVIARESTSVSYKNPKKLVVSPSVILKAGEKRIRDKVKKALENIQFSPVIVLESGGEFQTEDIDWL